MDDIDLPDVKPQASAQTDSVQESIDQVRKMEEALNQLPAGGEDETPSGFVSKEQYDLLNEKYQTVLKRLAKLEQERERYDGTPTGTFHEVQDGEKKAIRLIAEKYGVTPTQIERLNPGVNIRHLVPGFALRIK